MTVLALHGALAAFGMVFTFACFAIAVRRIFRRQRFLRQERRASKLRPLMMQLLTEEEHDLSRLDHLSKAEARMAENLAWTLLPKVRGSARVSLSAWLQSRGAIDRACRRTCRPGRVGRQRAAERLGLAGVPSVSPYVLRLLDDKDFEVRTVATRALGKVGDPTTVPRLLDALDGKKAVPLSLVSMALVRLGPVAVDELVAGLGRKSARARSVCAQLLGLHGAYQAVRWLALLVINDDDVRVRVQAATALGRLGSPAGVASLVAASSRQEPTELRVVASLALGQIGGDVALKALQEAIYDDCDKVAAAAAEALARLGEPGKEPLSIIATGEGKSALRAHDWLVRIELKERRQRRIPRRSHQRAVV